MFRLFESVDEITAAPRRVRVNLRNRFSKSDPQLVADDPEAVCTCTDGETGADCTPTASSGHDATTTSTSPTCTSTARTSAPTSRRAEAASRRTGLPVARAAATAAPGRASASTATTSYRGSTRDAHEAAANALRLDADQRAQVLPSGKQAIYKNRAGWAHDRLKAGRRRAHAAACGRSPTGVAPT